MPDRTLISLKEIAFKLDEMREHVSEVEAHLGCFPPGERDPISYDHLRRASDLGRHLSARIAALIGCVDRPLNVITKKES